MCKAAVGTKCGKNTDQFLLRSSPHSSGQHSERLLGGLAMQHYTQLRETPRWGEPEVTPITPRRERKQVRQYADELASEQRRLDNEGRASWTAPLKFGTDTVKPIEQWQYAHLLLAQEQELRNRKFDECPVFEQKVARSPTGSRSPLKIWVPPLKTERIKADGLPKALTGVDIGHMLALQHVKENNRQAPAKRYGACTFRAGNTASSKEALWAANLCGGRSDISDIRTNMHPALFTQHLTTAGMKRKDFLAHYAHSAAAAPPGTARSRRALQSLDIRKVGWAPNRGSLTYRSNPRNTNLQHSEPSPSVRAALRTAHVLRSKTARPDWDKGLSSGDINPKKQGLMDSTLTLVEINRENHRKQQLARASGAASWTQDRVLSNPLDFDKPPTPDFVF